MRKSIKKNMCQRSAGEVSLTLLIHLVVGSLLLAWCAHSSLQLVSAINVPSSAQVSMDSATLPRDSARREPVDIAALVAIPLFGEQNLAPVVLEPAVEKQEELEETKLNLVLKGLFTSNSAAIGRAIIANGRDEELYQVGDDIEGLSQVSLTAVLDDRIRLNNRGKSEVLYLYPEGERISSVAGGSESSVSPFLDPMASNDESVNGVSGSDGQTKKLSQIIRVVRERDKETGNMIGFRVLPGRDRGGFDKSGLQANDIITSIDGDKLNDLRSAMSIYRNKRDASQVSLMINRQGSEVIVDIDLAALP